MSVEKLIVDHMETWTSALQTRSTAGRGSSGKIDLYGIKKLRELGNDSNLLIVFYVQIMPDDFVMQLHRF
ncbi:Type I restriction enzyme EcoAI specificity protein (S protein) (S.EcoAI) [Escherichia coli]|nr:Type I restriction enzyme EcoAI specificity protein (S protein) (S.EcoAI) [Escherichia coli]